MKNLLKLATGISCFIILILFNNSKAFAADLHTYDAECDKYTSHFFYNQLTEDEQGLYDKLYDYCLSILNSTDTYTNTVTSSISYKPTSSLTNCNVIVQMFLYSNPQFFFLNPSMFQFGSIGSTYNVNLTLYNTFLDGDRRRAAADELFQQLDDYEAMIATQTTPFLKAKKAHDIVTSTVAYDYDNHSNCIRSAYSAIILHETICVGYADAFSMLCNASGLDTITVISSGHAWNKIRLNGSWYNVDTTFDDNEYCSNPEDSSMFTYFVVSDETMLARGADNHTAQSFYNGYLPSCTMDSGSTTSTCGSITTPTDQAVAPSLTVQYEENKTKVTLSSPTEDCQIYYTLDGTTPRATALTTHLYQGSFTITNPCTISAIAIKDNYLDSTVTS